MASSGKRMECKSKAQNEQPLKHILSIRIFDIFLEREEFHFLYFSSCIYLRHTLKERSFLATKELLFLIKRHSKCSKCYCWNCDKSHHQGFKAFPNFDNFEKLIFSLVHCYLIPFSVKISHVRICNLTNLIFINIHHQFPQTEADSGLVKLVMMTNVFFNNQPHKIKRLLGVKQITSNFFTDSWNQRFYL